MPDDFEAMWRDLASIGRSAETGGYFRQPYLSAEVELREWFKTQARARELELRSDIFGNLSAWWHPARSVGAPERSVGAQDTSVGTAVMTGSHLDSVLDGGAYDGPLGVASAFAAVDVARGQGFEPSRPIAIGAFMEEEGSRFGIACLGSRLATGSMDWAQARELRDRNGVFLPDAMEAAGWHPEEPAVTAAHIGAELRDQVGVFVELHVEQGRDLIDRGVPVGLASGIWPHGRYRFDFTGQANHAGTTRMEDRHDPMLTYAMTALAANKQARLAGMRATFGRIDVAPNGTNAVPSRVTAWLDARCDSNESLAALVGEIERMGLDRAARDGTSLHVTAESVSGSVQFDHELNERLQGPIERPQAPTERTGGPTQRQIPIIPTQAGHDAGILAQAGIPTAMLFVRNPTGISHSPEEFAEMADCLIGVEALADVLQELAR